MTINLRLQAKNFVARQHEKHRQAEINIVADACGIPLPGMLGNNDEKETALLKVDRLLQKERRKGLIHHWSYDLNRHIALKQLRDRLTGKVKDT